MSYNLPPYFQKAPVVGALPYADMRWKVYNRTGGATVAGGLYMLDMSFSQAETTTDNWKDAASCWRNIVGINTASTGTGTATTPFLYTGVFCIIQSVVADNAEVEAVFCSPDIQMLTVATNATQFYPRGSGVIPVTVKTYGAITGAASAITPRIIAKTRAAYDMVSATDGQEALRSVHFYGFGMP